MQTIYTTSCRLGVRTNNIIDLNEYRRSLAQTSAEPEVEVSPLMWASQGEERPLRRSRPAARVSAWLLDIMASAGVVAMTAVFTLQIL